METAARKVVPGALAGRGLIRSEHFAADIGVRPLGRTGSSRGFDRLPSVLVLELLRAEIAER